MLSGKKTYLAGGALILFGLSGFALTLLAPDVATSANVHVDLGGLIGYVGAGLAAIGIRINLPTVGK